MMSSDLFASVDAGRGTAKKQKRIQAPILLQPCCFAMS